jgi:hypothetical protein
VHPASHLLLLLLAAAQLTLAALLLPRGCGSCGWVTAHESWRGCCGVLLLLLPCHFLVRAQQLLQRGACCCWTLQELAEEMTTVQIVALMLAVPAPTTTMTGE